MPLPGIQSVGGNLADNELRDRISSFFSDYIDTFQRKLWEKNLSLEMFSFGKPTNFYFFIVRHSFHCIYSSQYVGDIAEVFYMDLCDQEEEKFSSTELASYLQEQRGITEWTALTFDIGVLTASVEERERVIEIKCEEQISREQKELNRKHQPLFIPQEEVGRFLEIASETNFTDILLIPLLRHIGFKAAVKASEDGGRALEFGQDIQEMKLRLPTGHWLFFSAKVKQGDIKSNKSSKQFIEKLLLQVYGQSDSKISSKQRTNGKPDHLLIIATGRITKLTEQYIEGHSLAKERRPLLWGREQILRLCDKEGLPEAVQRKILEYNDVYLKKTSLSKARR